MDSLILWVVIGVIAFAAFAWRMQRAKQKAAADRAAREAIAAATLATAKAEAQSQADAQRLEAERKAATKARKEAARAAANQVIQAEAERVRTLRASRTAEAERSAREAARRAVLEANQEAAAKRQGHDDPQPAQALAAPPAKPVDPTPPAPAKPATPAAPSPKPPADPAAFKSPEQTLILVADDSKVVRLKAGRLLAQHGYRVAYGVDGEDALRQVEAEMPDLVVTDVEMPNLDGFGLTRRLRGDARTAHVPIVMITSVDATHRESALREGVGLVLGKPFPEESLLAHIRSFRFPLAATASVRPASRPDFAQTDAGALA